MIPFYKMHANGNDFMIVDSRHHSIPLPSQAIVRQWSNRQRGVGFDQLLYLTAATSLAVDVNCRIFNASGSEAEQCGHGMACLAEWLYRQGNRDSKRYCIATSKRICTAQRWDAQRVVVDLGCPVFEPEEIPFLANQSSLLYPLQLSDDSIEVKKCVERVCLEQRAFLELSPVSQIKELAECATEPVLLVGALAIGNPHCVVLVSEIDNIPVGFAQQLSEHSRFPNGSNVEFMQVVSPNDIRVRVYERGVGFNNACGSGACAAVALGRRLGCVGPIVTVQFPTGAKVTVRWTHVEATLQLETATHFVFQGELFDDV